ncbi:MAG: sulfate adenylyltransferase [Nocardioidaceae bacterium]|jgi:sulfate adenylyltransferase|nr:sulfate adenylyltransferase [Nocardioidaceae bacterium]
MAVLGPPVRTASTTGSWQNRPVPDDSATPSSPAPRASTPQWTPSQRELDDLDLLLNESFSPPLPGYVDPSQSGAAGAITLVVDEDAAEQAIAAGQLDLVDPEGAPLARLFLTGTWTADDGRVGLAGPVSPLASISYGPFRRLYLSPADVHADHPTASLLAVPVRRSLTSADLEVLDKAAQEQRKTLLLLACVGEGMAQDLSGPALIRATGAAARHLESPVLVVAVGAADHGDQATNDWLLASICRAFADDSIILPETPPPGSALPEDVAAIFAKDHPPRDEQGAVFFFTGLSGSGKSTLARALMDHILEVGERTVTSLDGDVVRHHLSKGLGFSREDRETNILRIGYVAAEISRHGGLAICSPIAPFESTRAEVRRMVERAGGGFVLIHVATPLAECERRDRKGLYAKARAGLIPDFTGISSPYEEPQNGLKIDTTDRDIAECLSEILDVLTTEGWLRH